MNLEIARTADGYVLTQTQFAPAALDEVWDFFSNAENLEALTPNFLQFKILTPSPIYMRRGTLIDYRIKLFGAPMHWRTKIVEFEPQHAFVDEQLRGPYARWHHRHSFKVVEGGTQIADRVEYTVPFHVFGRLAHELFVRRTLSLIFRHRYAAVARIFS
jgi:ligand-binding SRPBCC domain-containing protein